MDWSLDMWLSDKKNAVKGYFGGAKPVPCHPAQRSQAAREPDNEYANPSPCVRGS